MILPGTSAARRPAAALAALAALAGALALAGCGIRPTQVPVDAGPAPSRVPCEVSGVDVAPQAGRTGVPVRVYLVCASQLVSVDRTAGTTEEKAPADRVATAQALLDELQREPSAPEHEAGFSTYVRGPLLLNAGRRDDPAGALRLSRQPEDLPPAALAQIVCTLLENGATADGSVLLGGPGDYAPRAYTCPDATKERPDAVVPTAGPPGPPH
ncbi:hypothetical protein [Streptomyces sp. ISL-10]|uniref:hypothetical protein n=1 Tax=Streptomyces sp. ISL-10 TaxID=2819172 RepID=UPI0027E5AA49|nr:hypothetical protein [Streptomyces sp. ISL-10]